jgi:peptide/nickel transport system substrate-binding protein
LPTRHHRTRRSTALAGVLALVCATSSLLTSPALPASGTALPALQLPVLQSTSFVLNFNPFSAGALPSKGTIYEPLYVVSYVNNGRATPWLATSYAWSKDLKTLTFTIRQGVKWSDGQPFTAKDVYYTIMLGKTNAAFDMAGLWSSLGLQSVSLVGADKVALHFATRDVTIFPQLVDNLYILPEHIWSQQRDPLHWTNPDPVGTGPFTQVENFQGESYTLAKNPYYWDGSQVVVPALTFTQYSTQDAITLALKSGAADWASAFIDNVGKVFDAANPQYDHHYFSNHAVPIVLYVNVKKYPFSLVAFRQALSMAINRAAIYRNAEYGYEPPANITGLNGLWSTWQDPAIPNTLAQYQPKAAKQVLLQAGFTYKGTTLLDPQGHPVALSLGVPTGWTDWIAMQQILAQDFQALGIQATVKVEQVPEFFNNQNNGTFDLQVAGAPYAATPYGYYDGMMGSEWLKPIGTAAGNNFGRYSDPAFNALTAKFRVANSAAKQRAIAYQMELMYVQQLPTIPLVIGALWEEFSTRHYTGFPDAANPYADGRPLASPPDTLLVFTHLRPTT